MKQDNKKDFQEKKPNKDKDNSRNNPQHQHNKDKKGGCSDCTF